MDFSRYQNLTVGADITMSFQGDSSDSVDMFFNPDVNTAYLHANSFYPLYGHYLNFNTTNPSTHETDGPLPANPSNTLQYGRASPSDFSEYSTDADSVSEFDSNINCPTPSTSLAPIWENRNVLSIKQVRRQVRELTYMDDNRRKAADGIVRIMQLHMINVNANHYINAQLPELQSYIDGLDGVTRSWVEEGAKRPIGTESNRVASDARKERLSSALYLCRWCGATFTVKHNLATHVRAHLDLHVSFCNRCDYSSTSTIVPARHRKACEAKRAKFSV